MKSQNMKSADSGLSCSFLESMNSQAPFSFPEKSINGWGKVAEAEPDTDSDDASSSEEQNLDESCSQEELCQLHSVTPDLVQLILRMIWVWVVTVSYTTPLDERMSEQNTGEKTIRCPHNTPSKKNQKNSPKDAPCSPTSGYFAMACPFYRLDPVKHQKCLQNKHLRHFGDVVKHIRRSHTAPPYCPTCFQKFDSLIVRDRHARARICKPGSCQKPTGLDKAQKVKIGECVTHEGADRDKWYLAWNILFPKQKPVGSPYLEHGIERQVCMVRDFWAINGRDVVSKYLAPRGLIRNHKAWEETISVRFHRFILKILLQKMFEQRELYEEDVGNEQMSHLCLEG